MADQNMGTREEYEMENARSIENEIKQYLDPYARFTESMFRRQALPILSGLLDDTFDDNAWIKCIGSPMVPLQVVADDDHSKLLFTVPMLFYTGPSLLHVEGQMSLTEESMEIANYSEIMPAIGVKAKHDLIINTLDGIEKATYETNRRRGKHTIDLLNWIFKRYGLTGAIPYPQGMEDLVAEKPKTPTAQSTVQQLGSIDDGEDM